MSGHFLMDEIDDFVDDWHGNPNQDIELHEYLGMTWEEYSLWVACPDCLSDIAYSRRRDIPLTKAVNDNIHDNLKLAARSDKAWKIALLQQWIDSQIKR